jgi:uncharacterized protein (TIGR02266 family)
MTAAPTDLTTHEMGREIDRRLGRVDLDVAVHLSSSDGTLIGVTKNLSLGGMFVAAARSLPIGERVAVRLSILDQADPLEIESEVRWSRGASQEEQRPAGMGLCFIDPLLQAAMFVRVLLRLRERDWF